MSFGANPKRMNFNVSLMSFPTFPSRATSRSKDEHLKYLQVYEMDWGCAEEGKGVVRI